jgi:hypothetical protein
MSEEIESRDNFLLSISFGVNYGLPHISDMCESKLFELIAG